MTRSPKKKQKKNIKQTANRFCLVFAQQQFDQGAFLQMHNNTEEEKTFQQPPARGRCFDVRMVSAFEEDFCSSRMSWSSVTA